MPDFSAISISPVQKDMTPIMVMQRVTASLEESKAAVVMSGILPEKAAKRMPIRIIPDHR